MALRGIPFDVVVAGEVADPDSLLLRALPSGFGSPWWLPLILGMATLLAVHRFLSKPVDEPAT